jgi:hypothetical protein
VKTNDHAVAAGHSLDPARWQEAFEGLMSRIAGRFTRVEPRRRAGRLVLGLLSDLPRKNCWTIAEWSGEATPDGMQHLLGWAKWDADQVRDDVRGYVVEHLHDDQAVLVVDETGDVKKGTGTVGVQRQYTGIRLVFMHQRRNVWAGRRVASFSVCQASTSACWQCSRVRPRSASQERKLNTLAALRISFARLNSAFALRSCSVPRVRRSTAGRPARRGRPRPGGPSRAGLVSVRRRTAQISWGL